MEMTKNTTLEQWRQRNPTTNPFANCYNIANLGGADLYWEEFYYRYAEREIFREASFVSAIERVFLFNKYKYERLLATTAQVYDMFSNYKVTKTGSEETEYDLSDQYSGTDQMTKGTTSTLTDTITITTETTPRVEVTTEETPAAKFKETVTPQTEEITEFEKGITIAEETTKAITTTTTVTPESYTDTVKRTTYDDVVNFQNVSQNIHTGSSGGETVVTPSQGKDIITTKPVGEGVDTTTKSYGEGSKIETVTELIDGTSNTTVVSKTGKDTVEETHSGTKATAVTGADSVIHGKKKDTDGTETLTYLNRTDSGYMYREPQNAIKDERDIARFAILDDILADVERATLLSIYLY